MACRFELEAVNQLEKPVLKSASISSCDAGPAFSSALSRAGPPSLPADAVPAPPMSELMKSSSACSLPEASGGSVSASGVAPRSEERRVGQVGGHQVALDTG